MPTKQTLRGRIRGWLWLVLVALGLTLPLLLILLAAALYGVETR